MKIGNMVSGHVVARIAIMCSKAEAERARTMLTRVSVNRATTLGPAVVCRGGVGLLRGLHLRGDHQPHLRLGVLSFGSSGLAGEPDSRGLQLRLRSSHGRRPTRLQEPPAMPHTPARTTPAPGRAMALAAGDAALPIPQGHIGPVALPGTGRVVWWTGRVAIGLRHEPSGSAARVSSSALWIQALLLGTRARPAAL
ncbi:MAG: hypothetical protein IT503_09165 [Burkholderiaceae bacterium]|nr:MAG: hypothetical protein F9K36_15325 [Burkholderiaceae bacterium]MBE7426785.1 hypothetical protein [Ideonella sp.]MCC7286339.1 hypothetical protein [Burkholderiaceae bacterium]